MDVRGITGAWCIAWLLAGCAGDAAQPDEWIVLSAETTERGSLTILLESTFEPYVDQCHPMFAFAKWSGTQWVPVPGALSSADSEHGYFMDGTFVEPAGACDESTACIPHPTYRPPHNQGFVIIATQARESMKVGTKPAPNAAPGAPEVSVYESKPLTGRLQVTNFYYRDDECDGPRESVSTEAVPREP